MADMAPVKLLYVHVYKVGGKTFAYYRRGKTRIRLPAPDAPDFAAAYDAARNGRIAPPETAKTAILEKQAGTLRALVALYKSSPEYLQLATTTRASYDRLLEPVLKKFGGAPVADVPRDWVKRRQSELIATPRTANYLLSVIRKVFSFGVEHGWLAQNPAARIKPLKGGKSHRIWTDAEIAALTGPEAGDVALPVLIALHTAQRQGDVLRLPWSAYDGQAIRLRQGKTGAPLTIPVSAELRAELDAIKDRKSIVICLTASGRPWTSDWFKHRFAAVRADLGLPTDLHFHGLRHTAATRLAEGGASDGEIMAMTGHKTRSMVARYTAQAQQESMAKAAVARLPAARTANKSG
jgi:integrase